MNGTTHSGAVAATTGKRLAVLVSFSGLGGVERMVTNLLPGFVAAGHAVDLLPVRTENLPLERIPEGVRVVDLGVRHSGLAAPGLARYLRRTRPDALLAAKDRSIRAAVIARALSGTPVRIVGRLGTNLAASLQDAGSLKRWSRYVPMRLLYRHVDAVIAVSGGVAEDTRTATGLPADRIRVVRNPVVTSDLAEKAREAIRHPWFEDRAMPLLLAAGRLTRQKDFTTLLRAFAALRRHRACRLVILGEGSERRALEALALDLGVGSELDLPGHTANPYAWMRRADLFVLSSAWEGSPNVLTEAMALGTPVVAADCPSGPAEILDGGRHGPLVPVGDHHALARAMNAVLDKPPERTALQLAVSEYTAERSARRYLDVLRLNS